MQTVPSSSCSIHLGLPTRDEVTCFPVVLHGVATEDERCARRERTHSAAQAKLSSTPPTGHWRSFDRSFGCEVGTRL
eukprot:2393774-Prymnesium_polylepis.1